jgi:hypothetical protein
MLHHFPEKDRLGIDDYLVFSIDITLYDHNPFATYLTSVIHVGYIFQDNRYYVKSFPPVEFFYSLLV